MSGQKQIVTLTVADDCLSPEQGAGLTRIPPACIPCEWRHCEWREQQMSWGMAVLLCRKQTAVSYFCWQVFTLPKVSSKLKLKLTALEGCRVRKVMVANFGSCKTDDYSENDLAVLTNLGDIQIISLPFLKLQIRYPCIRKEDVSGIASCVFTKYGQGRVCCSWMIGLWPVLGMVEKGLQCLVLGLCIPVMV